jgi:hypothetical protein
MVVDYSQGKIYKIEPTCPHDEGDVYIGSTSVPRLCNRLSGHKRKYTLYKNQKDKIRTRSYDLFDKYGVENCQIFLIENVNAKTKDELRARENFHITNTKCVNVRVPFVVGKPFENKKEWHSLYNKKRNEEKRQINEEKIQINEEKRQINEEKKKEYKAEQKQKKIEHIKAYYEFNKKLIKEKNNACEENTNKQTRIYTAEQKEKNKERSRAYYYANQERLVKKSKAYKETHKEQTQESNRQYKANHALEFKLAYRCECGTECCKPHKARHEKSKYHLKWLSERFI